MKSLIEYLMESVNDSFKKLAFSIKSGNSFLIADEKYRNVSNDKLSAFIKKVSGKDCVVWYVDEKSEASDYEEDGGIYPQWVADLEEKTDNKGVILFVFDYKNDYDKSVINSLLPFVLEHKIGSKVLKDVTVGILADPEKLDSKLLSHLEQVL